MLVFRTGSHWHLVVDICRARYRGMRSEVKGPSKTVVVIFLVFYFKSLYIHHFITFVHEGLLAFYAYLYLVS